MIKSIQAFSIPGFFMSTRNFAMLQVSGFLTFLSLNAFCQVTITMQPIQDAPFGFHDFYNSANNNYGYSDYYGAFSQPGSSGGENAGRSLMEFDINIPPNTIIISAYLNLYGRGAVSSGGDATSLGNVGQNSCYLERITSSWEFDEVTWNTQPSVTSLNSVSLPQSAALIQDYLNIDVTQMVQDMVNDPLNSFGFSMRLLNESPTRGIFFCSTDYSNVSKHPTLIITYVSNLTVLCEKFCSGFTDPSLNDATSWNWVFEGGSPSTSTEQNPSQICYSNPGVFDVSLVSSNGATTESFFFEDQVIVYPTPPFPQITQVGTVLISTQAESYQWQHDAIDIPGATNQWYEVIQSGLYTVVISNENGCVNSASIYILYSGIMDIQYSNFLIYPNPATNTVRLTPLEERVKISSIEIIDMMGRLIYKQPGDYKSQNLTIDVSSLSRGYYWVRLLTSKEILIAKLELL